MNQSKHKIKIIFFTFLNCYPLILVPLLKLLLGGDPSLLPLPFQPPPPTSGAINRQPVFPCLTKKATRHYRVSSNSCAGAIIFQSSFLEKYC